MNLDRFIDILVYLTVLTIVFGVVPYLMPAGQERELALKLWVITFSLLVCIVLSCGLFRTWSRKKMAIIPRGIIDRVEFRYVLADRILAVFGIIFIFLVFGSILSYHLFNNEIIASFLLYVLMVMAIIGTVLTIVLFVYFLTKKKGRELIERDITSKKNEE